MPQTTFYVKRRRGTIDAVLTVQRVEDDGTLIKVFDKLPVRSGQYPFVHGGGEDWVQGKGPTPVGTWLLSTQREALQFQPVGTPFYCLSSNPGERIMHGPNGAVREDAGLHLDNRFPGTIGCTAFVVDTTAQETEAYKVFTYLDELHAAGIPCVRYKVFF